MSDDAEKKACEWWEKAYGRCFAEDHKYVESLAALLRAERAAGAEEERAAIADELETLRSFASDMAEGDCEYGDNCPTFGARHGSCDPCRARVAFDATKGRGE